MNRNKIVLALLAWMCLVQVSIAETQNDLVKITLPNKAAIEIKGEDIFKYAIDTAFISQNINRFFRYYQTSNMAEILQQSSSTFTIKEMDGQVLMDSLQSANPDFYAREGSYQLSIDKKEVAEQIISSESFGTNIYYLQKHQLTFSKNQYTYIIKFDTIEQLQQIKDDGLIDVLGNLMSEIKNGKGHSLYGKRNQIFKLHYIVNNDHSYQRLYENNKYATDQILIGGGVGLESVKNTWAASFEVGLGFSSLSKGIRKNSYHIYYEWQYDFSNPDNRNINQFASIAYRRDLSKDPDKTNAYTFKLGYLIAKQGDLYNDNTFRFGVSRSLGEHVHIEPQIYFNDFFQDVIPSVKVGFSF